MVCPSLASALDTKEDGIADVLTSPAVVERFRHCALSHETPEKLRFTFLAGLQAAIVEETGESFVPASSASDLPIEATLPCPE